MSVLAWSWFIDVFLLQYQSKWFFCAWGFLRKPEGVRVGNECVVIIVSVLFVGCAALRAAPHTVFQDGIPDKPSTGITRCGVLADSRRIDCPRKSCSLLHHGYSQPALLLRIITTKKHLMKCLSRRNEYRSFRQPVKRARAFISANVGRRNRLRGP